MKLISFNTLLISFSVTIYAQKFQQEQLPFSSRFQSPSSNHVSDNALYLTLESQTPIPYFTMNGVNKLPFQFLPTTGTKTPSMYPTPLPMYLSSTLRFEEEENENDPIELSTATFSKQNPMNRPNNNTVAVETKRESKFNSRMSNQLPLQKFEVKPPIHVTVRPKEVMQTKGQNSASRRMIITSEIQRSDQGPEQLKALNSFQSPQYAQAPGNFISSTTEPAIPILRLSNEMDLDGSFSYEALGADQTHYVQHSRMENMGTDKEEQVVEGSYSYVGDDGRTYTVHYIADSNGFRATGDHLPVPPPVPEIIQRAVQYNLAEEAKKPPHLRGSWENDDKDYEITERNIYNSLVPRNLFTGKTPEAFSFGFSQTSNSQSNLVPSASFQVPTKSNYEISIDQSKAKINPLPISPQITFLASQGAHNPSTQTQTPTKTVNVEKSPLPQLMNYEAEIKDSDQDINKALWRWQYGLSSSTNHSPKNSISRSFGEGDDVIINFNEMTPEQYTHMIQTQILSENAEVSNNDKYNKNIVYESSLPGKKLDNKDSNISEPLYMSTEISNRAQPPEIKETEKTNYEFDIKVHKQDDRSTANKENPSIRPDIISHHNFIPQSQTATQSYTFDDSLFESSKVANENSDANLKTMRIFSKNDVLSINNTESSTTMEPIFSTIKSVNILSLHANEDNNRFKPIIYHSEGVVKRDTTTTEPSMDEKIRENIFLRNLFKPSHDKEEVTYKHVIENHNNENKDAKQDKEFNFFQFKGNAQNDIKSMNSKPIDINNFLNYVIMKNHFESIKTKQKNKPAQQFNQNLKDITTHYMSNKDDITYNAGAKDDEQQKQDNDYKTLNRQQQQEFQGLIKNYKVVQRQKNAMQRSQLLSEPQRHIKAFHSQSLPPLGRAGPSLKSYLPPTYL